MPSAPALIAVYLREHADRWWQHYHELPADHSSAEYAYRLQELAHYVSGLADADPACEELMRLSRRQDAFAPPNAASLGAGEFQRALIRFRSFDPHEDCGAFLISLPRLLARDLVEAGRLAGEIDV
jgi:hypothetical protein